MVEKTLQIQTLYGVRGSAKNILPTLSSAAFFGSSFNVLNQKSIEGSSSYFNAGRLVCLPVESPGFRRPTSKRNRRHYANSYGFDCERQNPTGVIGQSNLHGMVETIEESFTVQMDRADMLDAWQTMIHYFVNQMEF